MIRGLGFINYINQWGMRFVEANSEQQECLESKEFGVIATGE
jgi:hypothetical protein